LGHEKTKARRDWTIDSLRSVCITSRSVRATRLCFLPREVLLHFARGLASKELFVRPLKDQTKKLRSPELVEAPKHVK